MLRRVVSLLLLPCLLLAQSAPLAHAHGRATPSGHESRPHVHLGLAAVVFDENHEHSAAGHRHSHGAGGHHHHDADSRATLAPDSISGDAAGIGLAPCQPGEHDSDAVFVSTADAVASRASAESAASELVWLTTLALVVTDFDLFPLTSTPHHPPSPDARASDRPLYIRHSALLI